MAEKPQAPIAKVTVWGHLPPNVEIYAPGLPPGEHELYCEPEATAPYLRDSQPPTVLTNLVTRYTQPVVQNVGAPNDFKIEEVDLFVDPNGKWVKYEDFKVVYDSHSWLHDEVQRLEAEIKRLRGAAEPTPKPLAVGDPVTYAPSFASQLPRDGWTIDRLPTVPIYIIKHPGGASIAVAASEITRSVVNRGTEPT
jgi:hypothetical protein